MNRAYNTQLTTNCENYTVELREDCMHQAARLWITLLQTTCFLVWIAATNYGQSMQPVALKSKIESVQPMTGIVLWTTNEAVETAPIQLEYAYMTYREVTKLDGSFDWDPVEKLLKEVAGRKHQLILRWHDTYVGKKTGIPQHIVASAGYETTKGKSEGKNTEFPDWSHPALQDFALKFFTEFANRYDNDPRLAFVQVGFGLWAEYHIYDGPMKLGKTFPSKDYQARFLTHIDSCLKTTPWMISVDSADNESTPLEDSEPLRQLSFGLFDDSFNHKRHKQENEPNWKILGLDRWKVAPTGGEFAFFDDVEQVKALAPKGPYGISFEDQASRFHISFMIGDAQPEHQQTKRIQEAGMATGYAFRITKFEASATSSVVEIKNTGIAPIYYDAFPCVNNVRSQTTLKGLLPDQSRRFEINSGGPSPKLSIECDRLVPGQQIEYEADL